MIRTLDKLVVGTFIKLFVVVCVAVPPLFILGDFTENADTYLDRGLSRSDMGQAYFYKMAEYLWFSFPIAALVATVFTVYNMTRHREIVAAKAGGISFHRLVAPLVVLGVVLMGASFGLSNLVPRGNAIAASIQRDEGPSRTWRSDFVYRSGTGLDWQVDRLTADNGRMTGVVVERKPVPERRGMHLSAAGAFWAEGEGWTLVDGFLRSLGTDSTEYSMAFNTMSLPEVTERPRDLLERPRAPEEMTVGEINRISRILERTGGDPKEWLVRRDQMYAFPIAVLVIILFGAPLATSYKRGGAAFGVGASLLTVITFIAMLRFSQSLGEAGALSPWVAAWTPNIVFGAAALALFGRVRT
ncbi:MAG: LptF/LptG family permease [Gemmatimonadota bacterium]